MGKKILQISPYSFEHLGGVEKYAEILDEIFAKNTENKEFLSEKSKNGIRKNQENSQKKLKTVKIFQNQEIQGGEIFSNGVYGKVNDGEKIETNTEVRRFSKILTFCGGKDFEIIEPVKNFPLPRFWSKNFWKFVKKIRKNPPEIIISHIRFAPTAWLAFWLAKSINAKYIHIEHGTGFLVHSNFFIKNIAKIVDLTIGKYILKNADFVVTISQAGENWVKNFSGRTQNTQTIYRGFEMKNQENKNCHSDESQNLPFQKNNEDPDSSSGGQNIGTKILKIGFVGRLVPLKNLNSLLVTLSKISFKNWQLEIVGDGEIRGEWEKIAKNLGISEKIIFLGAKENAWILENFFRDIDIFVNPSLQEGLPTTVIEAKIAGCEVLATDVGGTHEIPDIILCEPTEKSICENLEKIFAKKLQKNEVSEEFKNKFSLEKMKENYENIFEKI